MVGKRILVIDDEQIFCEMMKDLLTAEGFEVDYAAHPIVATELALSGDYDLITLDPNLSDFDGSDVWSLYRDRADTSRCDFRFSEQRFPACPHGSGDSVYA